MARRIPKAASRAVKAVEEKIVVGVKAPKRAAKGVKSAARDATEESAKKARKRRREYMGKNPNQKSRTGREVIERMRREGKIIGPPDELRWRDPATGRWHNVPLDQCHMGHHPVDAVRWWNEGGFKFGPRSKEAREFMLNPDNYEIQPGKYNCSEGARLGMQYVQPWTGLPH